MPGCSKSVLASRVVDGLRVSMGSRPSIVIHYYCEHDDRRTLELDRIQETMIKQLIVDTNIPKDIESRVSQAYGDGVERPDEEVLFEVLQSLIVHRNEAYIILDGLDECEKQTCQILLRKMDCLLAL